MLCFTIETAVGGREGRMCRTGGCGAVAGRLRRGSRHVRAIPQWQAGSEVADRKAMCGILLGNAIPDSQPHWQESSEVAERKAMCGIFLGNALADS